MVFILIFLSLLSLRFCQYKKLPKYSSVKVSAETKVYLDLSYFKVDDIISLEIEIDYFFYAIFQNTMNFI